MLTILLLVFCVTLHNIICDLVRKFKFKIIDSWLNLPPRPLTIIKKVIHFPNRSDAYFLISVARRKPSSLRLATVMSTSSAPVVAK